MSNLRILVIEDHQNWLQALPEYLQRLQVMMAGTATPSITINLASNYEEAEHFIQAYQYDLIVTDLWLNGNQPASESDEQLGMDVLRMIQGSQHNQDCGLIVLTAYPYLHLFRQAFKNYEVHDFVDKNKFKVASFLESAREAIRKARLRRAEKKARRRSRVNIVFNQDYLVSCELHGPERQAAYSTNAHRRLRTASYVKRADSLNVEAISNNADAWRPEIRRLGEELYQSLLKEQCFRDTVIPASSIVKQPDDLWIQFSGPAPNLSIPFELLHNGSNYLSREHILTRQLAQTGGRLRKKTEPFHAFIDKLHSRGDILRVLIVGANISKDLPATEQEVRYLKLRLENDLQELGIKCDIRLLMGDDANYDRVSAELSNGHYHIFHYSGHGLFDEELPEVSGLVLLKEHKYRVLTAADLNTLVSNTELQMAFLSCCLGARSASNVGRGDFYGMLEAIASADVPIVLGYRWSVLDRSALQLALNFYENLWRTFSPGEALREARIRATLGLKGRDDETWASPVLVMQNT
jgi:CHAT domain-containing protein